MTTQIITKTNENITLKDILKELQIIKNQLTRFLSLIPEENLKEYKNISQIKKSYLEAIKNFPPQ